MIGSLLLMPAAFTGCKEKSQPQRPAATATAGAAKPRGIGNFGDFISTRPILRTPLQCRVAAPRPPRIPVIVTPNMEAQASLLDQLLKEQDLTSTKAFKRFQELTKDFSDEELCGLATLDIHSFLFNWGLLRGVPTYTGRIPFKSPREYFLYMAFLNASGKLLMQYDKLVALRTQGEIPPAAQAFVEGLEAALRDPELLDFDDFTKYLKLFRELYQAGQQYRDVGIFFDHPSYLWAASSLAVRKLTNPHPKHGKWIVHTNSLRKGFEMFKAILPCFDMNQVQVVKFDLDPYIPGVYRLIFYAGEKDPTVKALAETVAGKPAIWTYDWQCLEGQTLSNVLLNIVTHTKVAKLKGETQEAFVQRLTDLYEDIVRDPAIFRRLGFSEFQRQVFLHSLFLEQDKDLTDPATGIAHGYIRRSELAWLALPHIRDPRFRPFIKQELAAEKAKKESWNRPGLTW